MLSFFPIFGARFLAVLMGPRFTKINDNLGSWFHCGKSSYTVRKQCDIELNARINWIAYNLTGS